MDGCPCCVAESDKQRIAGKPLRMLGGADLDHYAFKAMTTWGTVADFKHFLPRIMELLAANALLTDIFVVLVKLSYGEWHNWPEKEQQAVRTFLSVWWEALPDNAYLIREAFIEIHTLTRDLHPLLKSWGSGPHYLRALVGLILYDLADIAAQKRDFKHFSESDSRQFLHWALGLKSALETAFFHFEASDAAFAEEISDAIYVLDTIRL